MTNRPTDGAHTRIPDAEPPLVRVRPEKGSRLEMLHAAYPDAKAKAEEAAAQLKAITDGIKLEMTQVDPTATRFALSSDVGPTLTLTHTETWRLDSRKLKAESPETYVAYAQKSSSWTLRAV